MKINPNTFPPKTSPPKKSTDFPKKPLKPTTRRKPKKAGPPTPLLRWKFDDERVIEKNSGNVSGEKSPEVFQKARTPGMSARKLAAILWRMQVAESGGGDDGDEQRKKRSGDRLGFKPTVGHGGDPLSCHHASREFESAKDPLRSPCSVNGPANGYLCEKTSLRFSNYAMEGATKWDPVCSKASNEDSDDLKFLDEKLNAAPVISGLEMELERARVRIEELESESRSSKKKLEHFVKKLNEEKAAWRSREHEKVRAIIDNIKSDLARERKYRQRLEIVNSKLVNELAEAKLSAKRYKLDYEKERKTRLLVEEVCDELAKEIGEDKAEVDSLKNECMKIREEVDDERKMLQMAEVWREERVQMKLLDAKVTLDQKYSQMNTLIAELEKFLRSKGVSLDITEMREAEMLLRASSSLNAEDIKDFKYEKPKSDDIFAVVEEIEREIEPCMDHSEGSGWETVTHAEDQGSSYSPRDSNVSGSFTEWEQQQIGNETPVTDISEVSSVRSKQLKKAKSISRLWRSCPNNDNNYKIIAMDSMKGRVSNGQVSTESMISTDRGSGKGLSDMDMVGWSSPDSRGLKKGCIEWSRSAQKNSLKHKLMEARMGNQKIQLRHVLKHEI